VWAHVRRWQTCQVWGVCCSTSLAVGVSIMKATEGCLCVGELFLLVLPMYTHIAAVCARQRARASECTFEMHNICSLTLFSGDSGRPLGLQLRSWKASLEYTPTKRRAGSRGFTCCLWGEGIPDKLRFSLFFYAVCNDTRNGMRLCENVGDSREKTPI